MEKRNNMNNDKKIINQLVNKIKSQGYKKICFWMPSVAVNGGVHYMCKLAKYFDENTSLEVYYMDYKDGYARAILNETNVKFLDYIEEEVKFSIKEPCIIFVNSTRVIQLKNMNPKNKVLFWHWETARCAWDKLLLRNETSKLLKLIKNQKAMIFHDWSSRNILNRQFNTGFKNKSYLSMVIDKKDIIADPSSFINEDEINIAWIGRISTDKVYALYNIIDNLANYKTKKIKVLHIIGDGLRYEDLKKYVKKYSKQIVFKLVGIIPNEQLGDYLINNADIVFAMGLSAIESASIRIPTAVVLLDTKPFKTEDFFWLFDTREYCVGITPEQKTDYNVKYTKFKTMIDEVFECGHKKQIANKTYDYYIDNFSDFNAVMIRFLTYIIKCSLTADKIRDCIRYMPYSLIRVTTKKFLNRVLSEKVEFNGQVDKYVNGKLKTKKS